MTASGVPRVRAVLVHLYTASGVLLAFLATAEICSAAPDPRVVFLLLAGAVLIDATDGTLARRWEVKRWLPTIEGRTIDDLVDYLTYTFVPLLLVWRMGWLPEPGVRLGMLRRSSPRSSASPTPAPRTRAAASSWDFPRTGTSWHSTPGWSTGTTGPGSTPWPSCSWRSLTVLPVRFLYPNLAPSPWRVPLIAGALVWLAVMLMILADYRHAPAWAAWSSLLYPLFYVWLSLRLSRRSTVR